MKKLSILLIGLMLVAGFAFAQDDEATMTEEEVVAAIEDLQSRMDAVEGPGLTATGSIDLSFGADLNDETPNLPQFSGSTSATATLGLGTSDDKVQASMTIDLLALPTITTTITQPTVTIGGETLDQTDVLELLVEGFSGLPVADGFSNDAVYDAFSAIEAAVGFWNDNNADDSDFIEIISSYGDGATDSNEFIAYTWRTAGTVTAPYDSETDIANGDAFDVETMGKIIADQLWQEITIDGTATLFNLVDEVESDGDIVLKSLVAPSATPEDDEFNFAGADDQDLTDDAGDGWYQTVGNVAGTTLVELEAQYVAGLDDYLNTNLTTDLDPDTAGDQDFYLILGSPYANAGGLYADLDAQDYATFGGLSAAERAALKTAVDQDVAFGIQLAALNPEFGDFAAANAVASNAIKSFSFKVTGVGGVLDLTAGGSGNVGVDGGINLDGKGHTDDTVKSYPFMTVGLTDGVVEGLGFDLSVFSDGNDAKNEVSITDDWYTLLDESADNADPVEPKLGLGSSVSYSYALSEDMTVGATAKVGLYDMLAEESAFGFSLNPTFSGFGANANVIFANGLGMTHLFLGADYTIMGITPALGFRYVDNGEDGNQIGYVKDDKYSSGDAAVLGEGGINVDFDVDADLSGFLPVAATVGAGVSYAMPTDFDAVLGWDADLSVTPIEIVTISAAVGNVGIDEGDAAVSPLTWNAAATATPVENVTVNAGVGQKWNSKNDEGYLAPSAGVSLVHGAATLSADYSTSYDADDSETYGVYALGMKVSF